MPRLRNVLISGAAALLVAQSPAHAATVTSRTTAQTEDGTRFGQTLFAARPGELNDLSIAYSKRGPWVVFRDRGARVHARGSCRRIDAHSAECPELESLSRYPPLVVRLGDRDDHTVTHVDFFSVYGQGGDDALEAGRVDSDYFGYDAFFGGRGRDTLRGRAGDDRLSGGSGRDLAIGGPGDDTLSDGEIGPSGWRDRFEGSQGSDTIDYSKRQSGVHIDLRREPIVRGEERDLVRDVENATGGRSNDRIVGDSRANLLEGGPGSDVLIGRGANDRINSGGGDDLARGGSGSDFLVDLAGGDRLRGGSGGDDLRTVHRDVRPREEATPDRLDCGGNDDFVQTAPWDFVTACEEAEGWQFLKVLVQPEISEERVVFTAFCHGGRSDDTQDCEGSVVLTDSAGTELGRAEVDLPRSGREKATVAVDLNKAGSDTVAGGSAVQVEFISGPIPGDLSRTFGYTTFMSTPS